VVRTILTVIGAAALICSALAGSLSKDDEAARDAALSWLQMVDSGKFEDAALQMSQEVRDQRDWRNYFATQHAPLGRVIKRRVAEVKHISTIPEIAGVRNYQIVRFKTAFERKSEALEEVTVLKMGCCWEVAGYRVEALSR
jgi:Protein of unknown function (DUF4019)